MQKVLRRTRLAQNQKRRKVRIYEAKVEKRERRTFHVEKAEHAKTWTNAIKEERKRRKENWELGPIAPWHEIEKSEQGPVKGQRASENLSWGSFGPEAGHGADRPKTEWLQIHELPIRIGDRVCVVEGRESIRGKIGVLNSINKKTNAATVAGINEVEMNIPRHHLPNPDDPPLQVTAAPIPYSSLRLVYPMKDFTVNSTGGVPKDTILHKLVLRHTKVWENLPEQEELDALKYDRYARDQAFTDDEYIPRLDKKRGPKYRYLMPQNIRIPWPKPVEPTFSDQQWDTKGPPMEVRSFTPTLLRPPMPTGVIEELRSKYSLFRVRHEAKFVAEKEREDALAGEEKRLAELLKNRGARNIARPRPLKSINRFKEPEPLPEVKDSTPPEYPRRILTLLGNHMLQKQQQRAKMTTKLLLANSPPASLPPPASI